MEPTEQNHGASKKSERPNLMSGLGANSTAPGKGAAPVRLLDAIEQEPGTRRPSSAPRRKGGAWMWVTGGVVAVAAGVLWLNAGSHAPDEGVVLAAATAASATPAAPVEPSASAAESANAAARIESMASADGSATPSPSVDPALGAGTVTAAAALATGSLAERNAAATSAPVQVAQVEAPPPAPAAAPVVEKPAAVAEAAPAKPAVAAKPTPKASKPAPTATAKAKPTASERTASAAKAKAAAAAKTKRANEAPDPDADVVAAIMASLDKRGGEPLGSIPSLAARTPQPATAPAAPRTPNSIAELVGRCNGLSETESLACRRKICDGYWGKAQACPASLAPQSSAQR